jgi:hypothetical protein
MELFYFSSSIAIVFLDLEEIKKNKKMKLLIIVQDLRFRGPVKGLFLALLLVGWYNPEAVIDVHLFHVLFT